MHSSPRCETGSPSCSPPTRDEEPGLDAAVVATVLCGQLLGFFTSQLFRPVEQRDAAARRDAEALADLALVGDARAADLRDQAQLTTKSSRSGSRVQSQ